MLKMQGISTLHYQPLSGIQKTPAMHNAAKILADMGREEDIYIVHAAEGETVIPMEVMEANPKMAEMVYAQLREMGLDPERYIVGNELNSINPETGMPEFFLSKLWKGIKKVAKVVLPIVATVWLASMGIPVPVANAITSGASTMIQGGSFKDGLKSAAIGYATGAVAQGVAKGINQPAGTSFGDRVSSGFQSMGQSVTQPFTSQPEAWASAASEAAAPTTSASGEFTDQGLQAFAKDPLGQGTVEGFKVGDITSPQPLSQPLGSSSPGFSSTVGDSVTSEALMVPPPSSSSGGFEIADSFTSPEVVVDGSIQSQVADTGLWEKTTDVWDEKISPFRPGHEDMGLIRRYGPVVGLGTLGVGAAGGFDETPMDIGSIEEEFATTGEDLLQQEPEKYGYNYASFVGRNPYFQRGAGSLSPNASLPPVYASPVVPTGSIASGGLGDRRILANTPFINSAAGGAINGPGTGTSDSIPAMLSDGEFVFTAQAVRGAGNGDRIKGAKEMYRTMKRLEGAA